MHKFLKIAALVTVCLIVGFLSSIVTQSSITTWYPTLVKPVFNPPNWIFAPVWTLLYIFMGISGGLIWDQLKTNTELVKKGLLFFAIQLALNALWSYLFFGLSNLLLASLEIILLLLIIFETYLIFRKIDKTAALLFIPYIIWVSFASLLTISIFILN